MHYDLHVEASLLPDIAFSARGEAIWRCLKREPGESDLKITLRDLVVTRDRAPVPQKTPRQSEAAIRFRMSDRGDIVVAGQEADNHGANPAKMLLEALLDAVPRLPASPIGENDGWTAQSREAATGLLQQEANQVLVRYECVAEEVPILFGVVVLSLSSSFESEAHNDSSEPRISGRGEGRIVLCPDDCTIKSLVHETWAVIALPQSPGQERTDAPRASYRMRLALNLIEEREVAE